jgi:hypothetical protein
MFLVENVQQFITKEQGKYLQRILTVLSGDYSAAEATGKCSISSATCYKCLVEANNPSAIVVVWNIKERQKMGFTKILKM